jgi:pyruvate formate lyase activating enzyme
MRAMEKLRCDFCYRRCAISPGQTGWCGIRANKDGKLVTLGFGHLVSTAVDPIEKKPLYHFMPGSRTLSAALFGCNFRCAFCQNYEIAQPAYSRISNEYLRWDPDEGQLTSPYELAEIMRSRGLNIMSYTYSDPIVWQDYMLQAADHVHRFGGYNCMVTNGSFTPESLERCLPLIDAYNIDVKGGSRFYRQYCEGELEPVLKSIETIIERTDAVVEVTTLVIEQIHSLEDIRMIGKRLYDIGVQVWHLSRFFPTFRMTDYRMTSEAYLEQCLREAAGSKIPFIYAGNSGLSEWEHTTCPNCAQLLITGHSYAGEAGGQAQHTVRDGRCSHCNAKIYGRFSSTG